MARGGVWVLADDEDGHFIEGVTEGPPPVFLRGRNGVAGGLFGGEEVSHGINVGGDGGENLPPGVVNVEGGEIVPIGGQWLVRTGK